MAQLFKYKGYLGTAEIDLDSKILCGKVLYISNFSATLRKVATGG